MRNPAPGTARAALAAAPVAGLRLWGAILGWTFE